MARLREFLQKNPVAGYAIAGLVIALAAYVVSTQLLGGGAVPPAAEQPPEAPAATPAPAPSQAAPPAGAPSKSVSAAVVPSAPMGRADPFVPLVVPATSSPAPRPPASPLPPPPFPVPGAPLPPPPLPGAPGVPVPAPVPPSPTAGISVSGIVSDTSKVVIVSIGGRTEILFEGESAGDLRVVKIDANRRTVTFERAGQRFDVTMGGG